MLDGTNLATIEYRYALTALKNNNKVYWPKVKFKTTHLLDEYI